MPRVFDPSSSAASSSSAFRRVVFVFSFVRSLSVCLCLCQTNRHMRVAMQAPRNKQNNAHSTLPIAEEAQLQIALRLWNPALASMCLLAQSAALASTGSSIVQQRRGCTVHSPLPSSPNHAATWFPHRPVFHKSRRPTIARPYHRFLRSSSNCSLPWFRRTFVAMCSMRASRLSRATTGRRPRLK